MSVNKSWAAVGAVSVGVVVIAVVTVTQALGVQDGVPARPGEGATITSTDSSGGAEEPGLALGLPCDAQAAPRIDTSDQRLVEHARNTQRDDVLDETTTASQASEFGRGISSDPRVADEARVAVGRAAHSSTGVTDPLIAADRCAWFVTVDAPFTARSAPLGTERPKFDRYTAVFDVASGEFLSVSAGPGTADLIAGTNLPH